MRAWYTSGWLASSSAWWAGHHWWAFSKPSALGPGPAQTAKSLRHRYRAPAAGSAADLRRFWPSVHRGCGATAGCRRPHGALPLLIATAVPGFAGWRSHGRQRQRTKNWMRFCFHHGLYTSKFCVSSYPLALCPHCKRGRRAKEAPMSRVSRHEIATVFTSRVPMTTTLPTLPPSVIKYPNRRLYDTSTSAYITLGEVKQLVLQRENVLVKDAKTGEDLTRSILLQIILEEEAVASHVQRSGAGQHHSLLWPRHAGAHGRLR